MTNKFCKLLSNGYSFSFKQNQLVVGPCCQYRFPIIFTKDHLLKRKEKFDSINNWTDHCKVCKDLELSEPEWSGKLTPRQIETLDQGCKNPYRYTSDDKDSVWSINPETGLVDVKGNFYGSKSDFIKNSKSLMGIKFGKIEGDFNVSSCSLTSMEGFPVEVTRTLQANQNKFSDLKGCTPKIGGTFYLSHNLELKSLEGAPEEIGGDFSLDSCRSLTSLEGSPKKIGGSMNCSNTSITNLKGAPAEIEIGRAHV